MEKIKIVLIFLATVIIACRATEKVSPNVNLVKKKYTLPCELCDFWINVEKAHLPKEKYLIHTLPYVDEMIRSNDKILENYDSDHSEAIFPKGPLKIYTQLEWNRAKAMRFCFIGKTKDELRDIFAAKVYEIVSTKNGLHFSSRIEHKEAESASYKINSPLGICSSLSQGRYLQFINFSADSIYLGNHRDSTFLRQCQNRDPKED